MAATRALTFELVGGAAPTLTVLSVRSVGPTNFVGEVVPTTSFGDVGPTILDPPVGTRLTPTGEDRFPAGSRVPSARLACRENNVPRGEVCRAE